MRGGQLRGASRAPSATLAIIALRGGQIRGALSAATISSAQQRQMTLAERQMTLQSVI